MDIEKIKNYNHTMLAIIVTAGVAFAVVGLISFIFFMITEVFDFFPRNNSYDNSAQSVEEYVTDGQQVDLDKMFIGYGFPELVDTNQQLFIIPVSQRTGDQLIGDYSRKLSFSKSDNSSDYASYNYINSYANLLAYDAKNGKTEALFKQRVAIGPYISKYFADDVLVLFEAAYTDTNKDNYITIEDQSSLFIYSMHKKTLKELKYGDKSVLEFNFIGKTKDMIVRFGIDPVKRSGNNPGIYSAILCKYNFDQDQLILINDEKLDKELHGIIEKTK